MSKPAWRLGSNRGRRSGRTSRGTLLPRDGGKKKKVCRYTGISHKSRSSVYAYPSEIDAWRAGRRLVAEALPTGARPSWWRPVAVGMTTLLCLVMVGSGIRPAEAAGTQTKQNRQIWVSAIEDASESITFRRRAIRGFHGLEHGRPGYSGSEGGQEPPLDD